MPRYNSRRHQKLMDESEYALQDASESSPALVSRVVKTVLDDSHIYRMWEARHADLLLPVAEHGDKKRQILALRNAEVQLVHRRALFTYLRSNNVRGVQRMHLFRRLHSTVDYQDAVVAEHRQYMLALSSRVSADHLIDVMNDPKSKALIDQYRALYTRYFEMQCYVAGLGNSDCFDLVRETMGDVREQLGRVRTLIETERPEQTCRSFDRQEPLARSGRYPVLNYMIG